MTVNCNKCSYTILKTDGSTVLFSITLMELTNTIIIIITIYDCNESIQVTPRNIIVLNKRIFKSNLPIKRSKHY